MAQVVSSQIALHAVLLTTAVRFLLRLRLKSRQIKLGHRVLALAVHRLRLIVLGVKISILLLAVRMLYEMGAGFHL